MGAEDEDFIEADIAESEDLVHTIEAELTLAEVDQLLEANTSVIAVETETTVTVAEEVEDLLEPELEVTIEAEVEEVVAIKGKPVDLIETVALSEETSSSSVVEI